MNTTHWGVTGMTCGHCVHSVTQELSALPGVSDVTIDLVANGTSTVSVNSTSEVHASDVRAALDEAGDYQLVGQA